MRPPSAQPAQKRTHETRFPSLCGWEGEVGVGHNPGGDTNDMAWERRGNQKFYYRSRKVNGRVVREYIGRGERAKRAAQEDAQKKAVREHDRIERREWESMDKDIAQLHQLTKLLTHSHLVNAGFYRHHRGEWRRRG